MSENHDNQSLSEEIFGFNFRSIRTLRDLIVRPNTVFKFFRSGTGGLYTPTLRLWIGLVGFQVILYYFWGGASGILKAQIMENPENFAPIIETVGEENFEPFVNEFTRILFLLQPVVIGLFSALSVFVLKPFNRDVTFPARVNIVFGILTVGTLVGLFLNLLIAAGINLTAILALPLVLLAYFITFVRGAPGIYGDALGERIMNGLVFSIVLIILVLLGNFLMVILSSVIAAGRI